MITEASPRHAAPRPRILSRRKPNRRPEATPYNPPTPAEIAAVDYLTRLGGPFATF